jgi:hypothetical protein
VFQRLELLLDVAHLVTGAHLGERCIGFTFSNMVGALSYEADLTDIRQVPEPATWLLLALGLLASHRLPVRRG